MLRDTWRERRTTFVSVINFAQDKPIATEIAVVPTGSSGTTNGAGRDGFIMSEVGDNTRQFDNHVLVARPRTDGLRSESG